MTRPFIKQVQCPDCHRWITVETEFDRWVRGHPKLNSLDGWSILDLDLAPNALKAWHRFLTPDAGWLIQCLMFVEVKAYGTDVGAAQADREHEERVRQGAMEPRYQGMGIQWEKVLPWWKPKMEPNP